MGTVAVVSRLSWHACSSKAKTTRVWLSWLATTTNRPSGSKTNSRGWRPEVGWILRQLEPAVPTPEPEHCDRVAIDTSVGDEHATVPMATPELPPPGCATRTHRGALMP